MSATAKSVDIRAPAAQEEGTRSQVLRWLKAIGEPVAEHEPLIELETDKVTVEVASPGAGVLMEILKQEQDEVAPGELLGRIGTAVAAGGSEKIAGAANEATGAVHPHHTAQPLPPRGAGSRGAGADRPLSPAVRRLLAEHSLDSASLQGTGEGGRITVADVMREVAESANRVAAGVASREAPAPRTDAAATDAGATDARAPDAGATDADATDADAIDAAADVNDMPAAGDSNNTTAASRRVAHTPIRKRIAARMVESLLHTAPHVTTVFEVDMSEVLAHRQRHREEFARKGVALTLTAYFAQAAVTAIRAVPEANSRWTDAALEIYDTINLGIATAAEGGLVVPVLAHVESLDLLETARHLEGLVRRARDGALTPADVRGGTFTLSNHGVSGSLLAAPIIIPQPQSAILGLGKLEKRAVVIEEGAEDRIVVRPRCYATLTIDHRVMDGSRANRFLEAFTERLTRWTQ